MKPLHFGIAAIAALVGTPAEAADLAYKAPPCCAVYSWTGFYLGGNVGYSWGNANSTYNEPALSGIGLASISQSQKLDGFIGGIQIGYNWQVNSTWVLGVEADIQDSGEKGSSGVTDPYTIRIFTDPFVTVTNNADIQWFGTVRGRIGVLVNPTTLLYGTGGLAYGGISASGTFFDSLTSDTASFGASTTRVGWTLGAGVEGAVPNTSNWTWKLEYLYIDFGTLSGNGFTSLGDPYSWNTSVTDNILRAGLNYRFDWGPAPAPCCITK
jgi:outer membrane immunogenic protein